MQDVGATADCTAAAVAAVAVGGVGAPQGLVDAETRGAADLSVHAQAEPTLVQFMKGCSSLYNSLASDGSACDAAGNADLDDAVAREAKYLEPYLALAIEVREKEACTAGLCTYAAVRIMEWSALRAELTKTPPDYQRLAPATVSRLRALPVSELCHIAERGNYWGIDETLLNIVMHEACAAHAECANDCSSRMFEGSTHGIECKLHMYSEVIAHDPTLAQAALDAAHSFFFQMTSETRRTMQNVLLRTTLEDMGNLETPMPDDDDDTASIKTLQEWICGTRSTASLCVERNLMAHVAALCQPEPRDHAVACGGADPASLLGADATREAAINAKLIAAIAAMLEDARRAVRDCVAIGEGVPHARDFADTFVSLRKYDSLRCMVEQGLAMKDADVSVAAALLPHTGHWNSIQYGGGVSLGDDFGDGVHRWIFAAAAQYGRLALLQHALTQYRSAYEDARYPHSRDRVNLLQLAAAGGHLDVFRWLHEHEVFDAEAQFTAFLAAAGHGQTRILRWAFHVGFPTEHKDIEENVYEVAMSGGHITVLDWLAEHEVALPTNVNELYYSALNHYECTHGHVLRLLQWIRAQGLPWPPRGDWVPAIAAGRGDVNTLRWLVINGCPWRRERCIARASAGYCSDAARDRVLTWIASYRE